MLRILKGKLKKKKCSIIGRDVTQPDIYMKSQTTRLYTKGKKQLSETRNIHAHKI